jgi:hypothetical protein
MRQEELWMAVAACVGAAFVIKRLAVWSGGGQRLRARRLDVIADALRDPTVDPATRAELLRALARDHHGVAGRVWQRLQQPAVWRALWFGAGWIGLLVCSALLALYGMRMVRVDPTDVAITGVVAFAMVTLPLALRELARHEHAASRR